MRYGERLRIYRVGLKLSQEEVAVRAGITVTAISKIERGTRKVTLDEAVQLAEIVGVSLPDLAGVPAQTTIPETVQTLAAQCAQDGHQLAARLDVLHAVMTS